jgi:hypothetical protein
MGAVIVASVSFAWAPAVAEVSSPGAPTQLNQGSDQPGGGEPEASQNAQQAGSQANERVGDSAAEVGDRIHDSAKSLGEAILGGIKYVGRTVAGFFTGDKAK